LPGADEPWCVYLLDCLAGRTYLGITPDLTRRVAVHQAGKGSVFTKLNRPVALAASVWLPNRRSAAVTERALKRLSRDQKRTWFAALSGTSLLCPATHEAGMQALSRLAPGLRASSGEAEQPPA
jgi:putative endonuclease